MKRKLIFVFLWFVVAVSGQNLQRTELRIPDIPGYITLKCDFHIHTYFSDGEVLPRVRVREAWREGLDAIAITDHIEWWRFDEGEYASRNKPYDDALSEAEKRDIILVKAIELTKAMPPGHINLLFLDNVDKIDVTDYRKALEEAKRQNAFVFWNHPGWKVQASEGMKWFDEHTEMFEKEWMNGIEIVNWDEWYPTAFDWAIDKNLTLLGNSDVHMPMNDYLNKVGLKHRPMTLVFAKDRTQESLKDALHARRTVLWFKDLLIGSEKYTSQLLKSAVRIKTVQKQSEGKYNVQLQNNSDFNFNLSGINGKEANYKLSAGKTIVISVNSMEEPAEISIRFENVQISSKERLEISIQK